MYIKRELETEIKKYLNDPEILCIIGPRQAGKTTLINNILNNLKNKKINRISFDNLEKSKLFEENIEAFIEIEIKDFDFVFIDEIQYVKDSGQKLKYIFDLNMGTKLIISGSSATEISLQSIKYLVGRILVFNLYTLSFKEFLGFKDSKLYSICEKKLFSKQINQLLLKYLEEYLIFGGYPRVVLENDFEKKKVILKNIFNTYLLKEIREILNFKESRNIENLVKVLSLQIGQIINYDDLSSKIGVSIYEIKNILDILEKTFIATFSKNYHTNKQTELVKSPKVFFYDLGLRNSSINLFEKDLINGNLIENFIASELLRKGIELKYWRTKSGAEVDFIIEKGLNAIPIEVKSSLNSNKLGKSLISYIRKYKPKNGYFLSKNYNDIREFEDSKILFETYFEFLFEFR